MKDFVKMTLATLLGLLLFSVVSFLLTFSMIGAVAALGQAVPVMPAEGVLKIDFSETVIAEQNQEADPLTFIQSGEMISPVGIIGAVKAINAAASDPAIKFIYMLPDAYSGGISACEELRRALSDFRNSGKPVISFIENPTNAGYYLASVSDKIFMSSHEGGMNSLVGLSSQMFFLKDILDLVGVNVQLIRHGKYKSAGEMYIRNSASKENIEQNQEMISSIWKTFAGEIAAAREIPSGDFNAMLDDLKLNTPQDMLDNHLVDELVTKEELRDRLCTYFVTDDYKDIKTISLGDYALLKNTPNIKAKDKVAVVFANGEIVDGDDEQNVAGDRFAKILSDIRHDDDIKAVVLRVNSPGGSVFASEKIKAELDLIKQEKTLVASYGDYAASGGYWISTNCDKIYSNATTLTGSIGVFSMIPDFSKVISNKAHVGVTTIKSNKHSDMYSLMRPLDQKETAYMQESVENIYDRFTTIVSQARGMSKESVDEIAQGRVWTGSDALRIGLVDEIGTLEDAVNYAVLSIDGASSADDVIVEEYPKPMTQFELFMESLQGTSDPEILSGTPFKGIWQAFKNWNASESGKVYARIPYTLDIR